MSIIRNIISNYKLLIVNCTLKQFHIPNSTFLILLFLCTLPTLSAQSPNYNIGDVITNPDGSKGVVFWLSPDGSGGWMCALNDLSDTYKWSTQTVIVPGFPALTLPSTSTWEAYAAVIADTAGYSHTQLLRAAGTSSTYPAAYAVDFAHGWYLPAIGQLRKLYSQQNNIGSALTNNGGSKIKQNGSYWSSTYASIANSYYMASSGQNSTRNKSSRYYIRPVRSFSIPNVNIATYQWNTGDTTASITVTPDTTTTYQVITTTDIGCSSTATYTLQVNNPDTVFISDQVLQGQSYTGHGFNIPADSTTYPHIIVETFHETSLQNGCDSCTILTLTVNPFDTVRFAEQICQGEPYIGHGFNIPADSTTYPHIIVETVCTPSLRTGCDSCTILTLTVNPVDTVRFAEQICQGESYTGHGFNIPADSTAYPHVIVETFHETSLQYGCDSCTILTLTINQPAFVGITGTDTICQGDTASLRAIAVARPYYGWGIGDILCTDTTNVKASNWPATGKTPMGIVFYVDSTKQHGLAVALLEETTNVQWGPSVDISGISNRTSETAASQDFNGKNNTLAIFNQAGSNFSSYTAAYNCYYYNHNTGSTGANHHGWFLPSAGQLRLLYTSLSQVIESLNILANHGTNIQSLNGNLYWSSTERSSTFAYHLNYMGALYSTYIYKQNASARARAIIEF